MKPTEFTINDNINVSVTLRADTGKCDVIVVDNRTTAIFDRSLPLDEYNRLVDFLRENDHQYAINMVNAKFG